VEHIICLCCWWASIACNMAELLEKNPELVHFNWTGSWLQPWQLHDEYHYKQSLVHRTVAVGTSIWPPLCGESRKPMRICKWVSEVAPLENLQETTKIGWPSGDSRVQYTSPNFSADNRKLYPKSFNPYLKSSSISTHKVLSNSDMKLHLSGLK
jgi:hypothetical protein